MVKKISVLYVLPQYKIMIVINKEEKENRSAYSPSPLGSRRDPQAGKEQHCCERPGGPRGSWPQVSCTSRRGQNVTAQTRVLGCEPTEPSPGPSGNSLDQDHSLGPRVCPFVLHGGPLEGPLHKVPRFPPRRPCRLGPALCRVAPHPVDH